MSSVELYYTTFFEFEQKEDKNLCLKKEQHDRRLLPCCTRRYCGATDATNRAGFVCGVCRELCARGVRETLIMRCVVYSVAMNRMNAALPSSVRL